MADFTLTYGLLLVVTGFIAGIINTLAGGGSNLTIPALMVLGMPPEIANATNRVGVFLQSLVAAVGFRQQKMLDGGEARDVVFPTLVGGILGACCSAFAPAWLLKPLLLGAMVTMALVILLRPSTVAPPAGTPVRRVKESPGTWAMLCLAGFYGGFVQAGVGFVLIAVLAGSLRYDLVRTNALKMVCTLAFTGLALVIFIWQDQILWLPGLTLAVGTMLGAHLAVRWAIKVEQRTLKWFLFIMTLCASAAALIF